MNESSSSFSYESSFEFLVDVHNIFDFDLYVLVWNYFRPNKVKVLKWLIILVKFNTMDQIQLNLKTFVFHLINVFFVREIQNRMIIYFYIAHFSIIFGLSNMFAQWAIRWSCKSLLLEKFSLYGNSMIAKKAIML